MRWVGLLGAFAVGNAYAQDDPAASDLIAVSPPAEEGSPIATDAGSPHNRAIEEIVVTSQKREEKLQDVPISIQAFSGDGLAARGVDDVSQLGQSVPSLQFTGVAGFTLIYIRGIGTDNFIPSADPSIATYVDGVYLPTGPGTTTTLGNIRRVEVLKGPQGTLFGRNATGGAISIVTEEPGQEPRATLEIGAGRFDNRSVKVNASGSIVDGVTAGLSAAWSDQEAYYTDINYKTRDTDERAIRVKLQARPADNLSIGLTGAYSRQHGTGTDIGKNIAPSPLAASIGITPERDDYQAQSDLEGRTTATQRVAYGNLLWNTSWFDVKLIASTSHVVTNFSQVDFDGSPMPIAGFDTTNGYTKPKTAELQFISNDETPLSDRFEWVAGLYYLRSIAGFDPGHLRAAPDAIESAAAVLGIPLPSGLTRLIDYLPLDHTPLGDDGVTMTFGGLLGTRSYSGYAQGTWTFNDWFDLTLGGRVQHEKRYLTKSVTQVNDPIDGNPITLIDFALPHATADNFAPKAVLGFHVADDQLLYASYSVGYKSGTFNIVNIYTPPNYIVPERVQSYEVGAKLDLLDGGLRINGAVFDNEIKNLQSGFVSLLSGGAVQFLTVPHARTRGAEIDGTWLPLPSLDPGLALTLNAAYVHATYTDFPTGSGFQKGTGLYSGSLDMTGNRIVRTPKVSGGIGVVQTIETGAGPLELAVDEYYNAGFYYDPYNTVKEKRYTVLNGHASFLVAGWNLRLTVYGKNLLDERYHVQQFQTDFGIISTLAPPREFGVRLRLEF